MPAKLPLGILVLILAGCGPSEPERPIKPLTERPPVQNPLATMTTAEQKIEYIQKSNAPKEEKEKAIAQIRAGQL